MVKAPNDVDRQVGQRVRLRRVLIGMSQEKLGDAVGITFQQVQKYEKGTNRVSASRLQQIATALGVPIGYFYGDTPQADAPQGGFAEGPQDAYGADILTTEGLRLARACRSITDPRVRRKLVEFAEALAKSGTSSSEDRSE